jgi:hypothetical protein
MAYKIHIERFGGYECRGSDKLGLLLENLRYAGAVGNVDCQYNDEVTREWFSFDVYAPKGVSEKRWAEMNVRRMGTFGIKATVVKY